jgi:STE24 endopeptidase
MLAAAGVALDSLSAAAHDSAAATTSPVHRDYIAEVRASFTPESRAYAHTRVALDFIDPFYTLLICGVLLFSGLSARMRDIAHRAGPRRYLRVLVYFFLFSLVTFAAALPLAWYSGYALEHQYGLSNQTFGAWLIDELKVAGFNLVFLGIVPLLALAYRAVERRPRTWWLWLGFGSIPTIVLTVLISPLVFEPAFNQFTPLHDVELKQEILGLAAKAGIPARKVYQVDKSAQTKKYNAYVSGFGASQRIVLWDTTLQGMKHDEILFVMGHEMGHYRLGHIWKGIAFSCVLAFALCFLAGGMTRWALARFGERWRVREPYDVGTLPLYAATLTILLLIGQPMIVSFSRGQEHEADAFGLEVTQLNDAAARAFMKLGSQNRNDPEPSPFVRAMLYDHPTVVERVRFALEYHPWDQGQPNRYFKAR